MSSHDDLLYFTTTAFSGFVEIDLSNPESITQTAPSGATRENRVPPASKPTM